MSRKTGNPNTRKRNRLVEGIDKRNLGYFNHIAYQIHNEQRSQDKENRAGDITPAPKTDHKRNTGESV